MMMSTRLCSMRHFLREEEKLATPSKKVSVHKFIVKCAIVSSQLSSQKMDFENVICMITKVEFFIKLEFESFKQKN